MKKILGLLSLLLILTACNFDNSDYPKKVSFGGNGGTRTIQGDYGHYAIHIEDYNGHVLATEQRNGEEPYDSFVVEYDWLCIKGETMHNNQLTITAAPNKTGKSRHLYITGMVQDDIFTIKVIQAGNNF